MSEGPEKSRLLPSLCLLVSVPAPSRPFSSTNIWILPGHLPCVVLLPSGLDLVVRFNCGDVLASCL